MIKFILRLTLRKHKHNPKNIFMHNERKPVKTAYEKKLGLLKAVIKKNNRILLTTIYL